MCGNPRHDVLQCRAYQQARKKFRAEQQEDRKPGHQVTTNNNRANHGNGNRSPRRWNNKHPRDDRRDNSWRNGRNNRNEHTSRSSNSYGKRRADDEPDRRERYSRDNRQKDNHREVRFRHANPPTPASARGGESSSRDAARLAPFSAAALPHDIIVGPNMEFTGHMMIGDLPELYKPIKTSTTKEVKAPPPLQEPYSPTAPPYSPDIDSAGEEEELIYCGTPDPSDNDNDANFDLADLCPPECLAEQTQMIDQAADDIYVTASLDPKGAALPFTIFANLNPDANGESDIARLKRRQNLPADLAALGQALPVLH